MAIQFFTYPPKEESLYLDKAIATLNMEKFNNRHKQFCRVIEEYEIDSLLKCIMI
jgi:hypothetical protein